LWLRVDVDDGCVRHAILLFGCRVFFFLIAIVRILDPISTVIHALLGAWISRGVWISDGMLLIVDHFVENTEEPVTQLRAATTQNTTIQ
jgi:hypothetical protein